LYCSPSLERLNGGTFFRASPTYPLFENYLET
jgi:hypothetical protein